MSCLEWIATAFVAVMLLSIVADLLFGKTGNDPRDWQ